MLPSAYETQDCSVARTLEVVGERWTLLIIRDALHGITRYDDFLDRLGIPTTTLAKRLGQLAAAGVLRRTRYAERPPRHEYRLTPEGRELALAIGALREWGDRHLSPTGPPASYRHKDCGGPVVIELGCHRCHDRLGIEDVERVEHRPVRRAGVRSG